MNRIASCFTRTLPRRCSLLSTRALKRRLVCSYSTTSNHTDLFSPTEEHDQIRHMVRSFTADEVEPQANDHNREEKFNYELFKKLGELGLHGITISEEYGGVGMDAHAACIVHEELSYSDPAFCLSYLAHSMLFVNNLFQNGNDFQKSKYLPDACTGATVCGMGMSEAGSGTDVLAMLSNAKTSDNGKTYTLNGSKMWITNGYMGDQTGDAFLIYARTNTTGKSSGDFSQLIVDKSCSGFDLGQKILDKCGMRASPTAELLFEDCEVPGENLVGGEGKALICMMKNLEIERLTLAAMSVGIARRCLDVMNEYAKVRKSFGSPLNQYGQIQQYISQSYAEYMAAKCYLYDTALRTDIDEAGQRVDSDGVKLFAVQIGKNIADRAIQVLGGNGYIGEYCVERLWRDSKLLEIGGGTIEAHQKNMVKDLSRFDKLP